jgi:Anti-sigma factor NepR
MDKRKAPDAGGAGRKAPKTSSMKQERNQTNPRTGLEAELQDHIGAQLRAVYNAILVEPVPDRFKKLLDELERKQAGSS